MYRQLVAVAVITRATAINLRSGAQMFAKSVEEQHGADATAHQSFLDFIAKIGRHYKDHDEFVTREQFFAESEDLVKKWNAENPGVNFEVGDWADQAWTELRAKMGLQ